jgi:hypothetical protein
MFTVLAVVICGAAGVQWFVRRQGNTVSRDVFRVTQLVGWGAFGLLFLLILVLALAAV